MVSPPLTILDGVRKLLPSQLLFLDEFNIKHINRYKNSMQNCSYNAKIKLLSETYKKIVLRISKNYNNILLPLTSGNDSRLLLAACLNLGIKPKIFTFNYPHISKGDRTIPFKIARRFELDYYFIEEDSKQYDYEMVILEHNGGLCNDGDKYFLLHGQFNKLPLKEASCILRSSISELSRLLYREKFDNVLSYNQADLILNKYKEKNNELYKKSLIEWIEWHIKHGLTIDWRDLFYIEQRICGWLSDIEQFLDILPFDSLQPSNSQFLIDIFLSFSDEERDSADYKHGTIEPEIIKMLFPPLLDFPINPEYNILKLLKKFKKLL